ncbi:NAD(P)H-hydrate epimerase, partial [Pseudomonas aeruginosa]|nr:NAD(P)H-hydrate epimerase [Pseudomonas aeruginosa]
QAHAAALATGVVVEPWSECAVLEGVVVDALLGTGLAGAVREPFAQAIRLANAADLPVLAVDIPSGLSADTGAVLGEAIRADLTVTFIGLKIGLFTGEAPARVGELVFDELGSDAVVLQALQPRARRLARNALPRLA